MAGIERVPTGAAADDVVHWRVAVTEPDAAEAGLLRTMLEDPGLAITEFRRRSYDLEDIFVQLVEGGSHDGQ